MKLVITIISSILLLSCTGPNKTSILGKWHGVTKVEGINSNIKEYIELHIDSTQILISGNFEINRDPIKYTQRDGSLYYYELGYSINFKQDSEDLLILSFGNQIDTLHRMSDSVQTYDEIDKNDTIALQDFYESFYTRVDFYYQKVGIEWEVVEDDTISDETFDFDMENIE